MSVTDSLQITIGRRSVAGWPVIAEYRPAGFQLASRKEGELSLTDGWQAELIVRDLDREAYGRFLGRALFQGPIRDAFMHARGRAGERLRLLLVVEDSELKTLHWERLCAPIGPAGGWSLLALDKQVLVSNYLPSLSERRFPAIGRRDLRALVVVANPPEDNPYQLDPFDEEAAIASISAALGEIPHDILASSNQSAGLPTLDELAGRLSEECYSLLHIVAHSRFQPKLGETIIYFRNGQSGQVQPVPATRLIQRLWNVAPLPHLVFLAACESAAPGAEGAGALGGLAQRLVWEIGVPAVIAMTEKVTIPTASTLTAAFYRQLQKSGEVDRALAEANTRLAEAGDVTVAALYSRLGARPLFSDTGRAPTSSEIAFGLGELERLLPERAPVLQRRFDELAAIIRGTLEADPGALSGALRRERQAALEDIDELCLEVLDLDFNALAMGQQPPPYDGRNPFRGLYAFGPEDSHFFFGREGLVEHLLGKVNDHNFLAILGPSGSGKSSLVLAGLLPRLLVEQPGLQVAYLTPGAKPLDQLRVARQKVNGGPALTVVDQFEELFTQAPGEVERHAFIDRLLALASEELVILTMRADFWGECAVYDALKRAMQAHQELVGPMTAPQLRAAMEQQAAAVGLRFEADLSQTMLEAVREEPGAMPLLQHALGQLWQRRHGRWLLTCEYREIGGVQKAIAETAEKIYRDLSPEEQNRMQEIFIRLTRLDRGDGQIEELRDTRQRVRLDELVPAGQDVPATHRLVKKFADERLVVSSRNPVTGQEEVEVAHEALIRYWPRLQGWLHADRDLLRLRASIREATQEYLDHDKDAGFLFHGARLTAAEEYYRAGGAELNEDERSFIEASIRRRQEQLEERIELERKRAEAERQRAEEAELATTKQRRLTRIAFAILAVALVAALLAGFFGVESNQNAALAQTQEAEAVSARVTADHNASLAATSEANALAEADQRATAQVQAEADEVRAEESAALAQTRQAEAVRAQAQAEEAAAESQAREFAALSAAALGRKDVADSLTWAIRAVDAYEQGGRPDATARIALEQALEGPSEPYLRAVLAGHNDEINAIAFSPDGKLVLTASADGTARLWEAETGQELAVLEWHGGAVFSAVFSPDGRQALTASADGTARLWDAATGRELAVLKGHSDGVHTAVFSPDGGRVLTASDDGTARIWEAETGREVAVLAGHTDRVNSAAFSPDGQRVVTASRDGTARLWDAATGREETLLEGHHSSIWSAVFGPDGQRVLAVIDDHTARLWEAETGRELAVLQGHTYTVQSAVFSPDGKQVLTASRDNTARLWESETGKELAVLEGHARSLSSIVSNDVGEVLIGDLAQVNSAVFSPDGKRVLTASSDNTARLWESETGRELSVLQGHTDIVRSAVFSPDGERILTASQDNSARLWDVGTGRAVAVLEGHTNVVRSALFSPDGERALTVSDDDTVRLWESETGREVAVLEIHEETFGELDFLRIFNPVNISAVFSPDGQRVLTTDWFSTARLWDSATGQELTFLESYTETVPFAAFSPDGQRFLTSGVDDTTRIWDARTGQELAILEGITETIRSAVFSPDGQRVLAVSGETARLLDSATGRELAVLEGHTDTVRSTLFSPDGEKVLTVSDDETARLWDSETGREISILEGPDDSIHSALFSPEGERILAISGDSTHLWEPETGQEVAILKGHGDGINSAVFSPDGQRILTASEDGTARLWEARTGREVAILEGHTREVYSAVFSPDGKRILTASRDATARLWDSETGRELSVLAGHGDRVLSAVFSPDGERILTASTDYTARLWRGYGDVAAMRAEAAQQLLPFLTQEACQDLGFIAEADCASRPETLASES